jgi:hypothetical protein
MSMTRLTRGITAGLALVAAQSALATSSTTFWTPATTYVQPYLVPHITYDTYESETRGFQNDYGLTVGVLPFEKLQGEIGIDSFLPGLQKSNVYLNGKLVVPEGAFGALVPGVSVGFVAVGFQHNVSDFDVLHATVGKTFPVVGNFTAGGYYGFNSKLMVSSDGKTQQAGFLGAWTSQDLMVNLPGLNKINFMADVQTGKNVFGAWGAGIGLYFTPAIDILTGPVFFFDPAATTQISGSGPSFSASAKRPDWLWTVQLDVDIDLVKKKT